MPAMPAMLGLSMNGGRAPGTVLAALTDAEDDSDEEDETAVVVDDVDAEEEEDEGGTAPAPPKPNRSGYMKPGSPS